MKKVRFSVIALTCAMPLCFVACLGFKGTANYEDEGKNDPRVSGERPGMHSSWLIVVGKQADIVEQTAADELGRFLQDALGGKVTIRAEDDGAVRGRAIVLGTVRSSRTIREAYESGAFHQVNPLGTSDDAFEISVQGDQIYVAGQTPRGVLYGAYQLDEYARRHANAFPDDGWRTYRKPAFRFRGTVSYNSVGHVFEEEDIRWLSRLGYTHMNATIWGLPLGGWGIAAWTDSSVFPSIKEPQNIQLVKNFLKTARRYGIEGIFNFFEPQNLCELYGADVVNRLGGDELLGRNGPYSTTCMNSPKIQEHYRSLMANLLRDFPEIGIVTIYENDGSFFLCDPNMCPRCKASLRTQTPPYDAYGMNWEPASSFVNLLQEAANGARPGVLVAGAAFHYLDKMIPYIDNLLPGTGVWIAVHHCDCWIYIPITADMQERLKPIILRAEERGVSFAVMDELTQSEKLSFAMSCPWPYATYNKLRGYADAGVKCFHEAGTPFPYAQSINALVLKECVWDPNQDEEALMRQLATDQFGEAAGEKMQQAWLEMKKAFEALFQPGTVWYETYMMTGNLATAWGMFLPLTVDGLRSNPDRYYSSSPDFSFTHFTKGARSWSSLAQLKEATEHLCQATARAREAIPLAPQDRSPFYSFCFLPRSRMTCREYAEEQYHSLNFQRYIFESNINFIEAEMFVRENKDGEAQKVIARENAATEEILQTSAAYMAGKIGLLHDGAARVTPFGILKEQHPVIQKLRRKLASPEVARKKVQVPILNAAVQLDGILDEPVWQQAVAVTGFVKLGTGGPAEADTTVRVWRDGENLYLGFECEEPRMGQLAVSHHKKDGAVYRDDCVGIFLQPTGVNKYYHLIANVLGAQYDERDHDPSWNGEWQSAGCRRDTAWTVEMKVPFRILDAVPKDGNVWLCNFNRERRASIQVELSSWSRTLDVFAEPDRFGEMLF